MTLQEKKYRYLNRLDEPPKERVFGRYNASEIYSIIGGYKKAEDHFKQDPIKPSERYPDQVELVLRGMFIEDGYNKILKNDCKCGDNQSKYEYKIDDEITIVVKPDFEWENEVWEMKCPREMVYEIPRKWKYQLEMESRATNKPVKLLVVGDMLNEVLIPYEQSDKTFEEIVKKIKSYHKKIKEIYGKQNTINK
jgi:hypothetical protein